MGFLYSFNTHFDVTIVSHIWGSTTINNVIELIAINPKKSNVQI